MVNILLRLLAVLQQLSTWSTSSGKLFAVTKHGRDVAGEHAVTFDSAFARVAQLDIAAQVVQAIRTPVSAPLWTAAKVLGQAKLGGAQSRGWSPSVD
jgi:hypothetical protein